MSGKNISQGDPLERNCPFYGYHLALVGRPFVLLNSRGNQCAIVVDAFSPCYLEIEGKPVDWRVCVRVADRRINISPEELDKPSKNR